jgi:ATP-dependent DNA helicase DinG
LNSSGYDGVHRLRNGVLPTAFNDPISLIHGHASGLSNALESLGAEVKLLAKEDPAQAASFAVLYAKLGQLAPKLNGVFNTASLLLEHGPQPLAKWFQSDTSSGLVFLTAHACPMVPGDLLRDHLWSHVRGAVISFASLTSCGSFD